MLNNKLLFSGLIVFGIVLLVILRLHDKSIVITTVVLCVLITVYGLASHFILIPDEMAADNLYYMGFIFTICTLGVSLYRFSTQNDILVGTIVGDLGVGLSTTVWGLFLRVLFLKWKDLESPEQIEDRVRKELVDVAEATITRIRVTADIVEEGQIATRQAIEEMNTSIKAASTKLVANTNQLEKRVSTMLNASPDLISSRLSPALDTASQSITRFTNQMDNIEIPADLIISRINQIFTRLAKAMADFTDKITVDIHERLSGIFDDDQAQNLIQQIEKSLIERLQAIEIPAELITERIEPVLNQINSSTQIFVNRMQNMSSSLEDTQRQLMECNNHLSTLDMDNVRSIVDARDAIDSLLKNVQETIETQQNLSSTHNQHLSDLSTRTEDLSAAIKSGLSGLSDLTIDLRNSLDALHQRIGDSAKPRKLFPWSRR